MSGSKSDARDVRVIGSFFGDVPRFQSARRNANGQVLIAMKAKRFIVAERPRLVAITEHPKVAFVEYEQQLSSMQFTVQAIQQAYLGTRERAVVVLEGWDAGKGGIVRRLGWAMDPRSFKVYPIAAPLSHEEGKHYLQRFWESLPDPGQIVVFNRSWYGRVLVERVEEIASKQEWQRGYEEINQFERMLVADGVRIVKCFLHITPAEQIRSSRIVLPTHSNAGSYRMRTCVIGLAGQTTRSRSKT